MNKKIITIAEIVFALVFVVLLALFMSTINNKGNASNDKLVTTFESINANSLEDYARAKTVKGSRVENAVINYKALTNENKIAVGVTTLVKNDADQYTHYIYGYNTRTNGTYAEYAASSTDPNYINPDADFKPYIVENDNGVVVGIEFVQVGDPQPEPPGATTIPNGARYRGSNSLNNNPEGSNGDTGDDD